MWEEPSDSPSVNTDDPPQPPARGCVRLPYLPKPTHVSVDGYSLVVTGSVDTSVSRLREMVDDREAQCAAVRGVEES